MVRRNLSACEMKAVPRKPVPLSAPLPVATRGLFEEVLDALLLSVWPKSPPLNEFVELGLRGLQAAARFKHYVPSSRVSSPPA